MEAELKWLDDPTVFRVNQIPAIVTTKPLPVKQKRRGLLAVWCSH